MTTKDAIRTTLQNTRRWLRTRDLADLVGAKESTVARALNTLRTEGRVQVLPILNDAKRRKQWAAPNTPTDRALREDLTFGPLSELQRAYVAGYFDAEGNVDVSPANHHTTWMATVTFGQTNPIVLKQLLCLRYKVTLSPARSKNPKERPKEVFSTSRWTTVKQFLIDVLPYVDEKRDQVEAVLQRFCSRMSQSKGTALRDDLRKMKQRTLPNDLPLTNAHDPKRRCSEDGCKRRGRSRGLCSKHYQRARLQGKFKPYNGRRAFRYRTQPTPLDLAYFAGYFDGDGTFEVSMRRTRWYVGVTFNQTRPNAIVRMAKTYGGSVRLRPPRTQTRRPQVRYYLGQQEAAEQFLRDLRPYLIEKAEEVDLFFRAFDPAMSDRRGRALKQELTRLRKREHTDTGTC